MIPRSLKWLVLCGGLSVGACSTLPIPSATGAAPVLDNLLRSPLEGVDGTEVIVSRVSIPPNTTLPAHWHPGEEFAYVLEGSATLWLDGKRSVTSREGEVVKVPLKRVHAAVTGDEGVELVVFRIHEQGQPERVPVSRSTGR